MVNSILVGVDDSPGATVALWWAERLVRAEMEKGRTPTAAMLIAWAPPAVDVQHYFDSDALQSAAEDVMARHARQLSKEVTFEQIVRRGSPAASILDEAERRDVDLIVLGSRGRSVIAQVLLGSVSRHVATKSTRPVAIVPEEAGFEDGPTVVAFDNSPGSRAALRWALANSTGEIKAVTAWSLPSSLAYDPADAAAAALEEATGRMLIEGLESVCGGTVDPRITPMVVHDDPRLAILNPDLKASRLVMGSRGHNGLKGLFLGSTVNYVATHATEPVIVVPPAEDATLG